MWLASVSKDDYRGETLATGDWTPSDFRIAEGLLLQVTQGIGRRDYERLFRMNITLCLHRGLTDLEIAGLPKRWRRAQAAVAGAPVAVLRETGVDSGLASQPCENPVHGALDPKRPDLWLPLDCRECEPCRARLAYYGTLVQKGVLPRRYLRPDLQGVL